MDIMSSSCQPTDVEIAQSHQLEPIGTIAERAGIPADALITYGSRKAKVDINVSRDLKPDAKLVLVTAMSPTPAGEGKSTVLIGLADALAQAGKRTMVAMREPSLGPVMGIKGGAAGGGYAQVVPMEDINLHFTGDFHAISAANNTLAAIIDNHLHQGNALGIDPRTITWKRCLDVNDRALRTTVIGLGGKVHGVPRETGFDITAASEIMAILCLARDLDDLKRRFERLVVGFTVEGEPVTAGDLNAAGAMTALMAEAINPNLVQTLGGTPALVHGGPFANIAHGCNSLIATTTAMKYADVVVTEAGFGSELGAEKFVDVKCRVGHISADAVVMVATIRSLKYNGGLAREELDGENCEALRRGLSNLERHCSNMARLGLAPVVALNRFASDTEAERDVLRNWSESTGFKVCDTRVWAEGGVGAEELARAVLENIEADAGQLNPLYDPAEGTVASLRTIATELYGAVDVELSKQARADLAVLRRHGWDTLPVVISKTQYSFSDDPTQLGAPEAHTLHVRNLIPKTGAGFVVALTGDVMTMPGLPSKPAACGIDVSSDGTISGLF